MISPEFYPLTDLRVRFANVAVYRAGSVLNQRQLSDYEFLWIIEGDSIAWFNGKKILAPEGTILLARPGFKDRYEWCTNSRTVHAYVHFDFKLPKKGWPSTDSWPFARQMPENDILRPIFRFLISVHSMEEPLRSTLLQNCIELMLRCFIFGNLSFHREPPRHLPLQVEKALKFLNSKIFQTNNLLTLSSPSLKEIAQKAHVSEEHLCRLFRQHLQLSPMECSSILRLDKAAELLARTNLTIKEISETTGFCNPYYFSRTFSGMYKVSPRKYRNNFHKRIPGIYRSSLAERLKLFSFSEFDVLNLFPR
jgi:AraC family transcriptional regulator